MILDNVLYILLIICIYKLIVYNAMYRDNLSSVQDSTDLALNQVSNSIQDSTDLALNQDIGTIQDTTDLGLEDTKKESFDNTQNSILTILEDLYNPSRLNKNIPDMDTQLAIDYGQHKSSMAKRALIGMSNNTGLQNFNDVHRPLLEFYDTKLDWFERDNTFDFDSYIK